MLIAIYLVLCFLSRKTENETFKFTFEALPILTAGFLMGPSAGAIVGGLGSLINQIGEYGITPTTITWVLPHLVSGLFVGLFGKIKKYQYKLIEIIIVSIISSLLVTGLNLVAIYVDAVYYNYYSPAMLYANLILKIVIGISQAIVFSLIMPRIIDTFKKKI